MNIKEAFRYQNFIGEIIDKTVYYLGNSINVMKTTQEHMRKKVTTDGEDEIIDTSAERQIQYPVNDLVDFLSDAILEKENISKAIYLTKISSNIDMDGCISINKYRQMAARCLSGMGNIRPTEKITRGVAYKFNVEGNQVPYNYDVKEVSVIDFDRSKVKAIAKRLINDADNASTAIDKLMIEQTVEFNPKYDVNDSFEDVIDTYMQNR